MCEPLTLISSAAIGKISAVMGIAQAAIGYSAAQDNYATQQETFRQNAENAATSAANQYSNLNIRTQQEGKAAAQAAQASEIEKSKAIASAEVAAAAGGVSGLAVDGVLRDLYSQAGRNEVAADTNLRMSRDYLSGEMKATNASAQSQVNSMPIPEKPSALPFVLQGFSAGLNSYTGHLERTKK